MLPINGISHIHIYDGGMEFHIIVKTSQKQQNKNKTTKKKPGGKKKRKKSNWQNDQVRVDI